MLYDMILIRKFEETLKQLYQQGKIHGTMHLCIGQEATAVGACFPLNNEDKITSTHRGHGHSIAKGTDVNKMVAELLGKVTGHCKGKGGSMHIADMKVGNLGANGIVAAGLPLGVGAALTSKMKELGYVVLCFFGDGATNEGAFHESLNLASIWKLPIIFFCENNLYGMSGSIKEMTNIESIAVRGSSYGIPSETINGNNILEVIKATQDAVERAKQGNGPTLIEAETYRWEGHSRSDARKYRTREEEKEWKKAKDPIDAFKEILVSNNVINENEFIELNEKAQNQMKEAVEYAEKSDDPSLDTLMTDIYA
ncbi:thiamine pyrophosphate-dependent dehydrogenase E1 component subunit alpha [Lysinibacillus pakistanensis]|uniref:Thiamine pyrophosphate-dependent dehydrogenase E1 component subunit alpha n=2 Tax=Lysinibacillus pakistanensis TaxID=759811 RepID=A0AAX3X5Q8_9BACI|nr:thiamine pyrophosphate-dependent dehydrogenase E1 component subunit alpha [Lysinibacillus pakistanensis]MDM5231057.1 thiamine pyrophosphate-dependent dehydrogenase E1 component subunit alpha [Lysinibacillus pakistanensis]WHY49251.1 thiamine pyrophosphate-dependent dehydrogenase E1 component subunit alpha [Lysinibacillus pakistanensis]WHY54251.1 thiamine pyrophosphate-dependent dehydrogenase E1 component subunit alpha [Lysinibacillus pakistanensis]